MNVDPSAEQAAIGLTTLRGFDLDLKVSTRERSVLRELAARVGELSSRPVEDEKKTLWTRHNDLESTRPVVFCDPENGWNEIVTQDQILCDGPLLRVWEMHLRKEIFWSEEMKDDRVIEPFFNVPYCYTDTEWGLKETKIQTDPRHGSYTWRSPIEDYERDLTGLSYPRIVVDEERTRRGLTLAQDILGDILQVRLRNAWWWSLGMTWDFIRLRGLENLMTDMIAQPQNVHRLMGYLRDGMLKKLDFLEDEGLLASNAGGSYVGSGGFGWTSQLPSGSTDNGGARTAQMWGFAESQETVGVSPEMFAEFIFPYQVPLLDRFGLNCYGCCEPVDKRWEWVRQIPRLRRVSVCAWADPAVMGEYLGREYILSWKPSPTMLARPQLDEAEVRESLRGFLVATRGNIVELMMKDNHTLGGGPSNAVRWVELAREEIGRL